MQHHENERKKCFHCPKTHILCDNCRCRKVRAVKTYLKDEPLRVKLLTLLCVDVRMQLGPKWAKKSPRMRVAVGAKKN